MRSAQALRKGLLVIHIVTSVGWLGAVLPYLALDLLATFGNDDGAVRSAYFAMNLTVRYALIPLGLSAVAIGICNALASPWGLFRHYWVAIKLGLTLFATLILLVESRTVSAMADGAAAGAALSALHGSLPHSIGGAIVLLVAAVLSTYKPKGLTLYGWRRLQSKGCFVELTN